MIRRIFSSLSSFKNIEFHPGLNILLVQKAPEATQQQTRNRAGKTSFVELVHFLTAGQCKPESIFRADALIDSSFGFDIDMGDGVASVERSGSQSGKIFVLDANSSAWPILPKVDKKTGQNALRNSDWASILGSLWFSLDATEEEEEESLHRPSFRSQFSYFARRQPGGLTSPFQNREQQQPGDQQVNLLYLLNLDWSLGQEWQNVRDRERTLRELKKAAGEGALGSVIGTTAELRTKLAVAEERARGLATTVRTFKVLPEYHHLELEASDLTRQLAQFADQDTLDKHLLSELRKSTESEQPPQPIDLERMYKEIGVAFTGTAFRRFDEVRKFHESVVENRKLYLQDEIRSVENRIRERAKEMSSIDKRRSEVMSILSSHGALDQHSRLQAELTKAESLVEQLRSQFAVAETLEGQKAELSVERGKLLSQLQHEFRDRSQTLREAIVAFEAISSQLYEAAGSLTVSETLNGPSFDINIQGSRSKGITNMQIFCFDMMLMHLCHKRGIGPGFLIHDSHIFDGVDERQIAKALEIGAASASTLGFQYIVTLNSDILDIVKPDLPKDFPLESYILPTRLTDETETGGLFGLRFE